MPCMGAFDIEKLEAEHQEQTRDMERLRAALTNHPPDWDEAYEVIVRIDRDLSPHVMLEEEHYFPFLSRLLGPDDRVLDQLCREHVEMMVEASALRLLLERRPVTTSTVLRALEFAQFFENHARLEQHLLRAAARAGGRQRLDA